MLAKISPCFCHLPCNLFIVETHLVQVKQRRFWPHIRMQRQLRDTSDWHLFIMREWRPIVSGRLKTANPNMALDESLNWQRFRDLSAHNKDTPDTSAIYELGRVESALA